MVVSALNFFDIFNCRCQFFDLDKNLYLWRPSVKDSIIAIFERNENDTLRVIAEAFVRGPLNSAARSRRISRFPRGAMPSACGATT